MRRHRFDPYSFVFGLAFTVLGAAFLDTDLDVADFARAGWLPVPAVGLGVFLLAVGLDRARSPRPAGPADAVPETEAEPDTEPAAP